MRIKYYYFAMAFFLDTSAGIVIFAYPLYTKEYLHLGALQIGIIAGLLGSLYTCTNLFFEKIEKIFKKEYLIYLGPLLVISSYLAIVFVKSLFIFTLLLSLSAIGHALFWPAFEAHLTLGKNESVKKKNLGYFNLGWLTGLAVAGPLAGGFIYEALGEKIFLAAGCIALMGLLLNLVSFKEDRVYDGALIQNESFDKKLLHLIWFSNFFSFLTINIVRTFFPLLGLELKMEPPFIGFVLFLPGVAQILVTLFLKNNPCWSYNLRTIIWGQSLAIFGMMLLSLAKDGFLLASGLILSGLMVGITNYSSNLMSLSEESSGKRRIGIHEAIIGLAAVISGFLGGGVSEILGLRAPYVVSIFLISGCMILEVIIRKRL